MFILPLVYVVFWKRKYDAHWKALFLGALGFIVSARVLALLVHIVFLVSDNPISRAINGSTPLYVLYGITMAGVFEEVGRWVLFTVFRKKLDRREDAFMYGIGHGGIEAIVLGGIANISGLITMIMINSGAMQMSLAAMTPELQSQTIEQLSTLWTTSPSLFFAAGIERVSAVILQIALSLIIYKGLRSGKKSIVALAYGIHFLVDFVAVACAPRLSIWVVEALIVVTAVASFMLAHKLNKDSANSAE